MQNEAIRLRDRKGLLVLTALALATVTLGVSVTEPETQAPETDSIPTIEMPLPAEADPLVSAIEVLGETIEPGTMTRLDLQTSESFAGAWLSTPVAVVHGRGVGPRLCIVAGIHGDEVNGVEVVRRTLTQLDPNSLRGTVVAVPIANLSAFRRGSRYLPDRRDLNRFFPGRPFGSSASRIAHGIFDRVVQHCDAVVDLHTGSFHRSNLHQLRANLSDAATADLSAAFGAEVVVNSAGRVGTLRRAATDAGIPAITVEAGESARFSNADVEEALRGIQRLLRAKGMIEPDALPDTPALTNTGTNPTAGSYPTRVAYLHTRWVRCDQGGILVSRVRLGDIIDKDQNLGTISNPLSDEVTTVTSPISGRIIGMAIDQVVMPGFAAFHIAYDPRPLVADLTAANPIPDDTDESDPDALDLEERPE